MNKQLENDLNKFGILLEKVKMQSVDFLDGINQRPTSINPSTNPHFEEDLNKEGLGAEGALNKFINKFESTIVSSSGPRYWGFVTGGSTPASILGDWLASIYDQNTQAIEGQGDVSAVIEFETVNLLLSLFNLPKDFLGGFVTGATMSNFTCLAVARQWLGKKAGKNFAIEGVSGELKILTATPHSSVLKSLSLLGIGSNNFIKIKTLDGNREAMDNEDLIKNIQQLKGQPFILISSGGTVNTVDFDDFEAIAKLKQKYNFWWHIDAAFGGFAACSPQFKHLLKGWELSDSTTIDFHKWLNVPFESAFYLVKEKHKHLQVETFQNSNAPYLGDPLENFNYLNFLPENSRRLKALPAWFTLVAYGKNGYQEIVENSVEMAKKFGDFIDQSEKFELLSPVRLNTVCFTLVDNQDNVSVFLNKLNASGKVFMTSTVYQGMKGIRAAFVNWRTTETDINIAIEEMNKIVSELKG